MSTDPLNETGFLEIWPVSVMCTECFLECDSKTRIRGKNPKKPGTKKAFGFYSVLVSPVLSIAGDFVTKRLNFDSETDGSELDGWSISVSVEAVISL